MSSKLIRLIMGFFFIICLCIAFFSCKADKSLSKPVQQIFEGRLSVSILGIEKVSKWQGSPQWPIVTTAEGRELIVIKFEVKNIQTGMEDTDQNFKDFALEGVQGENCPSLLISTDLREVPISVPKGMRIKLFRISGLTFDIEQAAKNLGQR